VTVLKHEMPKLWHVLSPIGCVICLIGVITQYPPALLIGLALTLTCSIWYAVNLHRLRRLARRIEGR
jgi:hypothetical protein